MPCRATLCRFQSTAHTAHCFCCLRYENIITVKSYAMGHRKGAYKVRLSTAIRINHHRMQSFAPLIVLLEYCVCIPLDTHTYTHIRMKSQ